MKKQPEKIICPYCNEIAIFDSDEKIYGKKFGMAYICKNFPVCDSYVGVHQGSTKSKGSLANKELRQYRKMAHHYFDYLWNKKIKIQKVKKQRGRFLGYKWLSENLGIDINDCHIGMFQKDTCEKVIALCKPYYKCKRIFK